MDANARKLMIRFRIDGASANALVAAGFDTPGKIRSATRGELQKVVSNEVVDNLKGRGQGNG